MSKDVEMPSSLTLRFLDGIPGIYPMLFWLFVNFS